MRTAVIRAAAKTAKIFSLAVFDYLRSSDRWTPRQAQLGDGGAGWIRRPAPSPTLPRRGMGQVATPRRPCWSTLPLPPHAPPTGTAREMRGRPGWPPLARRGAGVDGGEPTPPPAPTTQKAKLGNALKCTEVFTKPQVVGEQGLAHGSALTSISEHYRITAAVEPSITPDRFRSSDAFSGHEEGVDKKAQPVPKKAIGSSGSR